MPPGVAFAMVNLPAILLMVVGGLEVLAALGGLSGAGGGFTTNVGRSVD